MKKNLIATVLAAVIILSCLSLSACSRIPDPPQYYVTRIVLNVGAQAEIMVNNENTVSVVTPMNPEGRILFTDEDLTGYKPEKTVEKIFSLAVKAGLFTSGDTAEFSVSGDSDYAKALSTLIEEKLTKLLDKKKLEGQVKTVPATPDDELKALIIDGGYYSEEMVDNHIGGDLNLALALVRISTAHLPDDAFIAFYFPIFNCGSTITQKDGMRRVIAGMGEAYATLAADYTASINELSKARDEAETLLYSLYVAEDSDYRVAVNKLFDLIVEGKRKGDTEYDSALAAIADAEKTAKEGLSEAMKKIDEASDAIYELEGTFPTEVVVEYRDKALAIQEEVGYFENRFMDEFTEKYKGDIWKINSALKANKKKLMD